MTVLLQVNLTDQLTPKTARKSMAVTVSAFLQILEQFLLYCDVFGNTRENVELQLWLDVKY